MLISTGNIAMPIFLANFIRYYLGPRDSSEASEGVSP